MLRTHLAVIAVGLVMACPVLAGEPVVIQVTPAKNSIPQGSTLQFSAARRYIGSVSNTGGTLPVTVK
jgi:hypothetical protein